MTNRRWKQEHPAEADRHNWKTCACGSRMGRGYEMCWACWKRVLDGNRRCVEELWAEGHTVREMKELLGPGFNVSVLRSRGYNLPYRRPEYAKRMGYSV
jgi:hypothetical protein